MTFDSIPYPQDRFAEALHGLSHWWGAAKMTKTSNAVLNALLVVYYEPRNPDQKAGQVVLLDAADAAGIVFG